MTERDQDDYPLIALADVITLVYLAVQITLFVIWCNVESPTDDLIAGSAFAIFLIYLGLTRSIKNPSS